MCFTLPDGHAEALIQMQHGDDHVAMFAHTELERAPGERLSSASLMEALRQYARVHGMDPFGSATSGTMRRLSQLIGVMFGATRSASNHNPYYEGVRLRRSPEGPRDDLSNI